MNGTAKPVSLGTSVLTLTAIDARRNTSQVRIPEKPHHSRPTNDQMIKALMLPTCRGGNGVVGSIASREEADIRTGSAKTANKGIKVMKNVAIGVI